MPETLELTAEQESSLEKILWDFVVNYLPLGIYDPTQLRRPRFPVGSFQIELLEFDPFDGLAIIAGPVVLRTAEGEIENFLRVTVPVSFESGGCHIAEGSDPRAAYIVDLGDGTGACKETAALANV